MADPSVFAFRVDMCAFGMTSCDEQGEGAVMKPTGLLTNSPALASKLSEHRCTLDHRHVVLIDGRAGACSKYPTAFCEKVLDALRIQIRADMEENLVGMVHDLDEADPEAVDFQDLYPGEFVDDLTGEKLNRDLVIKGRMEEIKFTEDRTLYVKK